MVALPRVIGHRGAAAVAPENTIAGFEAAAQAGAPWVEFDIRLSADGVALVFHDETLARIAGQPLAIGETDAAMLRKAAPIPTLDETIDCLNAYGMGGNIEIKAQPGRQAVAAAVLDTLAIRPINAGMVISSFDPAILGLVRRLDRTVPLGLLTSRPYPVTGPLARALGCVSIHCKHSSLGPAPIRAWKRAGFLTATYTVNEPSRARRLLSWGLDSVITDNPAVMLARL